MYKIEEEELRLMIYFVILCLENIICKFRLFFDRSIILLNIVNCYKKGKWSMKFLEFNLRVFKVGKYFFVFE